MPVKSAVPAGTHACFEDTSFAHSLRIEPTLVSIEDKNKSIALVINMTGANVLLQPGTCLTRALVYGTRVVDTDLPSWERLRAWSPLPFPEGRGTACPLTVM